jgi:N-acetyl-gamma-glutamyl-phosphate reductase
MEKINVAIVGAKGFAARELIAILLRHPNVTLVALGDKSEEPESLVSVYPEFRGITDLVIEQADVEKITQMADVIFLALPHKVAQEYARPFSKSGKIIIDLSADFRFNDIDVYEKTYSIKHQARDLNEKAVYGMPELFRDEIKKAKLIGNPGCYTTSIILPCAPLMKTDWIDKKSIIADSKSGVSGAGRIASTITHYVSCNESIRAYAISNHRHTPEVEEKLSQLAGEEVIIQFTPHLTPMDRGILSTIYINMIKDIEETEIRALYEDFYKDEPLVRMLPAGILPATKIIACTNYIDIGMKLDKRTGRLILVSALDNLLKGASGQAVHNMNVILGFDEKAGLV